MTTPILQINKIPLAHIDPADVTYSMLPFELETDNEQMIDQINKTGIIAPPVVRENSTGVYSVVIGRQEIEAAQAMKISSVECYVIPPEIPELQVYTIALCETITKRQLSPVEKGVFFQKVIQHCSIDDAAANFLPILKLPQRRALVNRFMELVTIEQPIAVAVHEGTLDEKAAYQLINLSFRDRFILFEVISTLHLSVSNQRKLILYCTDLSLRENSSILTVLSSKDVQEIISHKDANPPQKAANLMSFLEGALSPRHTEAKKAFNTLKQSLNLPKWATLSHTAAFEKDELTLTLKFDNSHSLKEFCTSCLNKKNHTT